MDRTKKSLVPFAVGVLAVLAALTVLLWGITTGWGRVQITRTNIQSTDGKTLSAVVYRPVTATNETPAPLVVNLHGRANSAHVCDSWALEEARRGYVAVSMDINGGGVSDPDPQNTQVFNYLKYLWTLPFIQADQTTVIGYSAGNTPCSAMISSSLSSSTMLERPSEHSRIRCPSSMSSMKKSGETSSATPTALVIMFFCG